MANYSKTTTKNGNPVWELKGVKGDTDMINVMLNLGHDGTVLKGMVIYQKKTLHLILRDREGKPKKTKPADTTSRRFKAYKQRQYGVGAVSYQGHTVLY